MYLLKLKNNWEYRKSITTQRSCPVFKMNKYYSDSMLLVFLGWGCSPKDKRVLLVLVIFSY